MAINNIIVISRPLYATKGKGQLLMCQTITQSNLGAVGSYCTVPVEQLDI